jgi:glycosyltransferase involved in cell wall biosynthesis
MADHSPALAPPTPIRPDLSLVVPCYNEEDVLRNTVRRLAHAFDAAGVRLELVLVDNGSTDGTGRVIDELIAEGLPIIKQAVAVNVGYGNGILRGLPSCRAALVGFICADGQVEANDVVRLYDIAARATSPKLVKVRRRFRMDGALRKVVSTIYNFSTTALFGGLGSIDINGNPKILPRDYLERMELESTDWFLDAEVMIKARRLGLAVLEINVLAQMREGGKSHVRPSTCREFVANLLAYRFGRKGRTLQQQPVPGAVGRAL